MSSHADDRRRCPGLEAGQRLDSVLRESLEQVGDRWSLMLLAASSDGGRRFEDYRRELGVATSVLAERLARLVAAGLIERRAYSQRPPRDIYVLTLQGRRFGQVLAAWSRFAASSGS